MYSIDSLTVNEYLEKIAEPSFPGPASGSAAATVAAMSAALMEMSCIVSLKKDEGNGDLKKLYKRLNLYVSISFH